MKKSECGDMQVPGLLTQHSEATPCELPQIYPILDESPILPFAIQNE